MTTVEAPVRRLLTIGGGGFMMGAYPAMDEQLLVMSGKRRPRICFLPTASGDNEEALDKFYDRYRELQCIPTHLAVFRKPRPSAIPPGEAGELLRRQDVVYVGGGNTRSMLAVWREWGIDRAIERAYACGTLISGMSAGAICWYQVAASDSVKGPGTVTLLPGLGWIPGTCMPHFDPTSPLTQVVQRWVLAGECPPVLGLPDGVMAYYENEDLRRFYTVDRSLKAYTVGAWGIGESTQFTQLIGPNASAP